MQNNRRGEVQGGQEDIRGAVIADYPEGYQAAEIVSKESIQTTSGVVIL